MGTKQHPVKRATREMKQRWVLIARYATKYGNARAGRKFGLSRERVRQILILALNRTRFTGKLR
jgi:DNA-directed RNA polymerase sigma subunit (sigma70/sigma32)